MKNRFDISRFVSFLFVISILIVLITGCALQFFKYRLSQLQHDLNRLSIEFSNSPAGSERRKQVEEKIRACQDKIEKVKMEIKSIEDEETSMFRDATKTQDVGCFPAETMVLLHNNQFKPIIELRLGDLVQTYSVNNGKLTVQPVIDLYRHRTDHFYLINNQLRVTGSQPLLTDLNTWKKVQALSVGEKIQSKGKMIEIRSIAKQTVSQDVYNLKVAGKHNYLVSPDTKTFYVVHNGGGGK